MGEQPRPIEIVRAFRAVLLEVEDMAALAHGSAETGKLPEAVVEALSFVAPDFDFDFRLAPYRGVGFHRYSGPEGILRFWTDFLEVWSEFRARTVSIEEVDGVVLAETEVTGTSRAGIPATFRQGELWYVRDGKLTRCRAFGSREDAVAALAEEG